VVHAILREAERNPSPNLLQGEGLARLLVGRLLDRPRGGEVPRGSGDSSDLAVRRLEEAHARAPGQAGILNDLSAAYFVRARQTGDPSDFLRALNAGDRAVALDGALLEARFNRALVLQVLGLPLDAEAAWDEYLKVEPDPRWLEEAETRREALRSWGQPGRQEARKRGEEELLPAWAEAWLAGQMEVADWHLRAAREIGAVVARLNGDRMTADAVAAIDAAARSGDEARLRALAEGHLAFLHGLQQYRQQRGKEGAIRLASARDAFRQAGSPFVARSELFLAGCDYRQERYREALQTLEDLERIWAGRPYPGFLGELLWMRAATRGILGDMAGAIRDYQGALTLFGRLGEPERVATLRSLLAEILDQLGQRKEAWTERFGALHAAFQVSDPRYRTILYIGMADATLQEGYPGVALRFWNQAVRHAAVSQDELMLADALSWRGLLRYRLGQLEGARKDVVRAREHVDRHDDEPTRRRSLATLSLIEGQLRSEESPAEAVRLLTDALQVYEETGHQPLALLAYRARAQAFRRAGELKQAEEDLAAGLKVSELFGQGVQDQELRLAYLGATEETFDEMISLQALDLGEMASAFETADRARTRVLPARLSRIRATTEETRRLLATEVEPLGLEEVRSRLPPATTLVQYSVLSDRLLVWEVSREGFRLHQKAIRKEELEIRVARLRAFGRPGWGEVSRELYELLLQPWLREVGDEQTLVFIPDKALHALPFAALRDRVSGRYLIADHPIAVAPSATLYVQALERELRSARVTEPRVLAVGNPSFDRRLFDTLAPLPEAEEEARALAALHPASTDLLLGDAASRHEFLIRVRQYDWVHFAGHAMVNERNPLLSMLLLAPTRAGETGALSAREIYPLDLDKVRMVVLSACETGGYVPGSEGVSFLARAFLAAGVPTVVASLWDVEDHPTAALFQAFYEQLSRQGNTDPVSALRRAQLAIARSPEGAQWGPAAWAAFEVIGASAR
jgi:CHAT domain-containing protein/tetratricopeptide (TPR) repeat protein